MPHPHPRTAQSQIPFRPPRDRAHMYLERPRAGHSTLETHCHAPPFPTEVKKELWRIEEEDIRRRAFEIYVQRCLTGRYGTELTDWFQAERELTFRDTGPSAPPGDREGRTTAGA